MKKFLNKKVIVTIALFALILIGIGFVIGMNSCKEKEENVLGDDIIEDMGEHRGRFYGVSMYLIETVGEETYDAWIEKENPKSDDVHEMEVVQFIKHFNIKREQFDEANKNLFFSKLEWYDGSLEEMIRNNFEIYNGDIIYTFDNKIISDYYSVDNESWKDFMKQMYEELVEGTEVTSAESSILTKYDTSINGYSLGISEDGCGDGDDCARRQRFGLHGVVSSRRIGL